MKKLAILRKADHSEQEVKHALDAWIEKCQKLKDDNLNHIWKEQGGFPDWARETLQAKWGPKFIKVWNVKHDGKISSIFAFVDKANGDIYKPAGVNAPAKHACGNLFDESGGMKGMGPYGPAYLR